MADRPSQPALTTAACLGVPAGTGRRTATSPSANSAMQGARTRRAASDPGQVAPAPSAPQNVPNVVSSTPTTNFMVFSGTRASGARTATPASPTSSTALTAASAASGIWCALLPNV